MNQVSTTYLRRAGATKASGDTGPSFLRLFSLATMLAVIVAGVFWILAEVAEWMTR